MSVWAVLQHVPFEGPGVIEQQARFRGIELDCRRLYDGDAVPALDEFDGLVVLGGSMSVSDSGAFSFLREEIDLLACAVAERRPILGICLGAQLLAHALGVEVVRGPEPELGLGSVTLTPAGAADAILGGSGRSLPVMHWHQDAFALPDGAELLASSSLYEHQACRVDSAYGLQFHVEIDSEWAGGVAEHLPEHVVLPRRHVALVEMRGRMVLGRFFDAVGRSAAGHSRRPTV